MATARPSVPEPGGCARRLETPTPTPAPALELLVRALRSALSDRAAAGGRTLVVAFSGGPDSTALLAAAARLGAESRAVRPLAAHFDHGLDADSSRRRARAAELAAELGVELVSERWQRPHGTSGREAAARMARYAFLERVRRRSDGVVATAHHRDDQVETVLLRLLQGSGLLGLAGIQPAAGDLVRPFLTLPGALLRRATTECRLQPVRDPTNDLDHCARNRLRHDLLPRLAAGDPTLAARTADLATTVWRLRRGLDRRLLGHLQPQRRLGTVSVPVEALRSLPAALRPGALATLHRWAGAGYPPTAAAQAELGDQLERGRAIGCECGGGWRWEAWRERFFLLPPGNRTPLFSYTLEIPGDLFIPEASARIRVRRVARQDTAGGSGNEWCAMLAWKGREPLQVRNRRPRDCVRRTDHRQEPLRELMRRRPLERPYRDRLPLLCAQDRVLWAPGLGQDVRTVPRDEDREVVLAELLPSESCPDEDML